MKKAELLRILALLLALGILQPVAFVIESSQTRSEGTVFDNSKNNDDLELNQETSALIPAPSEPNNLASVHTEAELFSAVADTEKSTIILQNDIVIVQNLVINRDLMIDLNGFNLTSLTENARLIDIKYGHVTLTGQGSIVAFGNGGTAIRIHGATTADNANYSSLVVEQNVTLFAPNQCGILVATNFNSAYGTSIELAGSIVAHDGIAVSSNIKSSGEHAPRIHLTHQAKITADENEGTAIQALGYGIWEIGACELTAATGICFAAGEIHIDNPHILATGYVFTQIASDPHNPQKLEIESGLFAGRMGVFYGVSPRTAKDSITKIRGGAFNADVSDYLEPGRHLEKNYQTGAFIVIEEVAPIEIMDEETRLTDAATRLGDLIEFAENYLAGDYAAGDLGEWQTNASKATTALKRALTIGKKALKNKPSLDKILSAINSLHKAIDHLQAVGAEIRSELASVIATVNAIEPSDYTKYSYQQVAKAMENGLKVLNNEEIPYEKIYSALLDLQINLDLLEIRDSSEAEEATNDELLTLPDETEELDYHWNDLAELAEFADEDELSSWEALGVSEMLKIVDGWQDDMETVQNVENLVLAEPDNIESDNIEPDMAEFESAEPEIDRESETVMKARENLRTLLNAVSALNPEEYTSSSYTLFIETVKWAGDLVLNARSENELNLAFDQVNSAYSHLEKTSDHFVEAVVEDTKANLQTMVEAVEPLTVSDYEENSAEQFGELQVALAKAKATLGNPEINLDYIVDVMDEITAATTGLKIIEAANSAEAIEEDDQSTLMIAAQVDWSELKDVIMEIRQLDPARYTTTSYASLLGQLEIAKSALSDPSITQAAADDIVFELNLALLALEPVVSPTLQHLNEQIMTNQSANNYVAPVESANLPTINEAQVTANEIIEQTVTPNLLMSMMAGAYAGLATYRKSRLSAKKQKRSLA